jgi:hypothetical protein
MTTTTLNELVYSILNTVRGRTSITELITKELVAYHVRNVRAQLIKQDSNRGYSADPYIIQDLGCLDLEKVDSAECCNGNSGCTVLRTVKAIPSTIEMHHKQLITRVGPIDKTAMPFDWIDYSRVPFIGLNKFTKDRIKAYQMSNNGHIYLITPNLLAKGLKKINVQGVFENPEDAALFTNCEGLSCYNEDSPYPIKSWMIPTITKMVIDMFVNQQAQAGIDFTNNAKADITPQTEGN